MSTKIEALIPTPSQERIDGLEKLVRTIVDGLAAGQNCDALIAQIDFEAGSPGYNATTFTDLYSWASEHDFAELAAMGRPPTLSDMTIQDVVKCLEIINEGEEPRCSFCLGILEKSFPHAAVSDLIYYSKSNLSLEETAARIIDKNRDTKAIIYL
jgi:hypothetical protein